MIIKDILKEANRYEDVMGVLFGVIKQEEFDYPVDPFIDGSQTKWRVEGSCVRNEAIRLLYVINNFSLPLDGGCGTFDNLYQFVKTRSDMMLHNYSIGVAHRVNEPKEDMEVIRTWLILENLLCCLYIDYEKDDEESGGWYIPDGWKKVVK